MKDESTQAFFILPFIHHSSSFQGGYWHFIHFVVHPLFPGNV
jgi:hypothetical protein